MAIDVEIVVFPGLPNPRFALSGAMERECRERLAALRIAGAPPATAVTPTETGYHGIWLRVIDLEPVSQRSYVIFAERATIGDAVHHDQERHLERWLFDNAPPFVKLRVQLSFEQLTRASVSNKPIEGLAAFGIPPMCADALPLPPPPTVWDDHTTRNNCYNYALNLPSNHWALPGGVSHAVPCADLITNVKSDGPRHLPRGFEPVCSPNAHLFVACLVDPNLFSGNFHFLRLDRTGWSHKFGICRVTNKDANSHVMTDLTAARFPYRLVACGVFEHVRDRSGPVVLF